MRDSFCARQLAPRWLSVSTAHVRCSRCANLISGPVRKNEGERLTNGFRLTLAALVCKRRHMSATERLSLRVSPTLRKSLEDRASAERRSLSNLAEKLLAEALERDNANPKRRRA